MQLYFRQFDRPVPSERAVPPTSTSSRMKEMSYATKHLPWRPYLDTDLVALVEMSLVALLTTWRFGGAASKRAALYVMVLGAISVRPPQRVQESPRHMSDEECPPFAATVRMRSRHPWVSMPLSRRVDTKMSGHAFDHRREPLSRRPGAPKRLVVMNERT